MAGCVEDFGSLVFGFDPTLNYSVPILYRVFKVCLFV